MATRCRELRWRAIKGMLFHGRHHIGIAPNHEGLVSVVCGVDVGILWMSVAEVVLTSGDGVGDAARCESALENGRDA